MAARLIGAVAAPFLIRELGGTAFLLGLVGLSLVVLPLVGPSGSGMRPDRSPAQRELVEVRQSWRDRSPRR